MYAGVKNVCLHVHAHSLEPVLYVLPVGVGKREECIVSVPRQPKTCGMILNC